MMDNRENNKIEGIEEDVIKRMIILIRNLYPLAEEAALYLELKAGIENTIGVRNLRDVLSHFKTMTLAESYEVRIAQIAQAEEHIRRSIIEPYEIAADDIIDNLISLYEEYEGTIVPFIKDKPIPGIIDRDRTKIRLEAIQKLIRDGRIAKGENQINEKWGDGVLHFIEARRESEKLFRELSDAIAIYRKNRFNQKLFWLQIWAIIATVVGAILGALLVFLK